MNHFDERMDAGTDTTGLSELLDNARTASTGEHVAMDTLMPMLPDILKEACRQILSDESRRIDSFGNTAVGLRILAATVLALERSLGEAELRRVRN
jgi:hypothetical protein